MINKEKKLKAFERALEVMDRLRAECPWNHAQTIDTLRPMTVEEVYELSDAVMKKDDAALEKELGDVFLHVIFYARIAEEEGRYDIADVMDKLCEKMIYRHPHVFSTTKVADAEQVSENWEMLKAKEKGGNKRILSGIPDAMPPILRLSRCRTRHVVWALTGRRNVRSGTKSRRNRLSFRLRWTLWIPP